MILGAICGTALALRALWRRTMGENVGRAMSTARQIKLGTNLLITVAQAAGYIAEILSGTRTTLPGVGSTTAAVDTLSSSGVRIPSAETFNSRRAGSLAEA